MPRNNPKTIRTKETKKAAKKAPAKVSDARVTAAFNRAVTP